MKFWQLISIFRDDSLALERLLQDPQWGIYLGWFRNFGNYVRSNNRQILDSALPKELVETAIKMCQLRFRIEGDFLFQCTDEITHKEVMSTSDVYHLYGGAAIEEVLEHGCFHTNTNS